MSFVSFQFVIFVLASVLIYRLVPAKFQWIVLLISSVLFYMSFSTKGIVLLLVTSLITYFGALQIQKQKDKYTEWLVDNKKSVSREERKKVKESYNKKQKRYLAVSIMISVFFLFLCKYYGKLALNLNQFFRVDVWTAENIILPLGISYYSLQLISYITDVQRDIIKAEKNPLKVILYGVFFLSIMQGPFVRYGDLMPQICGEEKKSCDKTLIKKSVYRILGGYVKKMCIADQVGILANEVFSNYDIYSGLAILLGIFCFAVQLYADFSGYMDIVIGISELLGFELPENFRQPFFSRSISEFWQRWHITLGNWLKDYVFYPVLKSGCFKNLGKRFEQKWGKTVGRQIPTYVGMFILWMLIGVWHGAGMNYVFSVGILQFLYIFIGEITMPISERVKKALKINSESSWWHVFQSVRVTCLMMFAWIFFDSGSMSNAIGMIGRIFHGFTIDQIKSVFSGESALVGTGKIIFLSFVIMSAVVLILVDLFHEKGVSICEAVMRKGYIAECVFVFALIFSLLIFGAYGSQYNAGNFIYFEF